ncbi:MAG: LPXTG cell wall anchor domain-containing protein [Candidatus Aenigmarchaeota archaeon]|nr:LPXTG cell wall anchor domain-containing protein [Candidatus Aenigmarchaeota archaeon]
MPIEFLPQTGASAIAIAIIAISAVAFLVIYQAKMILANRRQRRQHAPKEKNRQNL